MKMWANRPASQVPIRSKATAAFGQTRPQGTVADPPKAETIASQKAIALALLPASVSLRTCIGANAVRMVVAIPSGMPIDPTLGRAPESAGTVNAIPPERPRATSGPGGRRSVP